MCVDEGGDSQRGELYRRSGAAGGTAEEVKQTERIRCSGSGRGRGGGRRPKGFLLVVNDPVNDGNRFLRGG